MIKEEGKIEKIKNRTATVRIQKSSACAHCESQGSCSISKRDMLIEVPNDLKAGVGDQVEVSMPEGTLLKLSALVYLLPIIALLSGAFLGTSIGKSLQINTSLVAIATGGIFMGITFFGLMLLDRRRKTGNKYYPRMTRIVISAASLQTGGSR